MSSLSRCCRWAVPCVVVVLTVGQTSPVAADTGPGVAGRVFRKVVGRDPSPGELQSLMRLPYDEMVERLLVSEPFQTEGYYDLHRQRLVLEREGSEMRLKESRADYCSLKLELAEQAAGELAGARDYWDVLRYETRWVPVSSSFPRRECFLGASIDNLLAAYKIIASAESPVPEPPAVDDPAFACVASLWEYFPVSDGSGDSNDARQQVNGLMKRLARLPASERAGSLLDSSVGEEFFWGLLNRSEGDGGAKRFGEASLVRQNGKAVILREQGHELGEDCVFYGVDQNRRGSSAPAVSRELPFSIAAPLSNETPSLFARDPNNRSLLSTKSEEAVGSYYVAATVEKAAGMHANGLWLSLHTSSPDNKHLHRARLIYHSYFCNDINPDAANQNGEPVVVNPLLSPYFADDDLHKDGSANCYNCHTLVQPLANFFGQASFGTDYNDDSYSLAGYFLTEGDFDRPGGLWEGDAFFPLAGGDRGLRGLSNLLAAHPASHSCVVNKTWSSLVGEERSMTDYEATAAVTALNGGGDRRGSLVGLVRHFLRESPRSRAYFTEGEQALDTPVPDDCPETMTPDAQAAAITTLETTCARCHKTRAPTFIREGDVFDPEHALAASGSPATTESRSELWQDLTCAVTSGRMPLNRPLAPEAKAKLSCYLRRHRNMLALQGSILADYFEKPCVNKHWTNSPPHQ